jgi:SH3-like domain-containing protein
MINASRPWRMSGWAASATAALALAAPQPSSAQSPEPLALPRFASLKLDMVQVRQGPGSDQPVLWTFNRAGWPVDVIRAAQGWRQVRDTDGATGWIPESALSERRTVVATPWEKPTAAGTPAQSVLYAAPNIKEPHVAYVEAGAIATLVSCNGQWCRISSGAIRGWIEQPRLWGVRANEVVK